MINVSEINLQLQQLIYGSGEALYWMQPALNMIGEHEMFPIYMIAIFATMLGMNHFSDASPIHKKKQFIEMLSLAFVMLASFFILAVVITFMKKGLAMPRPYIALGIDPLIIGVDKSKAYRSFPSGHAAFTAFMVACLWRSVPPMFKLLGALLVVLMMWSRVTAGLHYPVDVLAGTLIGMGIPMLLMLFFKKTVIPSTNDRVTLNIDKIAEPIALAVQQVNHFEEANLPVVCVHGLTRNSSDFEFLADQLGQTRRVIFPDMPGRGDSPNLTDSSLYNNPFYGRVCLALIEEMQLKKVDWVGTSMGGIIGMMLAATKPELINKLVINDVGATIPALSLERLKKYVGTDMEFDNRKAAQAKLKELYQPFGITEKSHWQHLFESSLEQTDSGSWRMRYDAGIGDNLRNFEAKAVDLWPIWNHIKCPVLLLRGADSDLFERDVAIKMRGSRSNVELVEIEGCGHAPSLYTKEQIKIITDWLG